MTYVVLLPHDEAKEMQDTTVILRIRNWLAYVVYRIRSKEGGLWIGFIISKDIECDFVDNILRQSNDQTGKEICGLSVSVSIWKHTAYTVYFY